MVAECYSQGICRIEILGVKLDFESLLKHKGDLFLGGGSITAYRDFGLSRSILGNLYSPHGCSRYGSTLGTSQFQDDLGVLAIERGFHSKFVRIVCFNEFSYSREDIGELLKRVLNLSEVEESHVEIVRPLTVHTNNPVTEYIGSGIDSKYDLFLAQGLVNILKACIRTEDFRNSDTLLCLVVLKESGHDTRKCERTSVESMGELHLSFRILVSEFQTVGLV